MMISSARLSFRDLRRRPAFALTVVLTVAIGIGAATAAFALVDAAFLSPLPVQDQGRLVTLMGTPPAEYAATHVSWAVPWALRGLLDERRTAFVGVTAYRVGEPYPVEARQGGHTLHLGKTSVAGNFFEVLGVKPALGRLLNPVDDVPGAPDVVVLGNRTWRNDFGSDPSVVGRLVFFGGAMRRVIGVAPPQFSYPNGTSAWVPVVAEGYARWRFSPDRFGYFLVARLQRGVTLSTAGSEFDAAIQIYKPSAAFLKDWGSLPPSGSVEPYADVVMGPEVRPGVMVVFGTVLLLLVVACINIAGLIITRGMARSAELAVRAALGASRSQLIGVLFSEASLLAVAGGLLGVVIAMVFVRTAVALAPPDLPMIASAHLDLLVLAFAATVTIVSVLGFGLAPAFRVTRLGASDALRGGPRSFTGDRAVGLTRRALVAGQVALTLVVLGAAGLLGRTVIRLQGVRLGFDPGHLLYFRIDVMVPSAQSRDSAFDQHYVGFLRLLSDRLPATPGLGPMTASLSLPFTGSVPSTSYILDDQTPGSNDRGRVAQFDHALDDYFHVMGIRLVQGRSITRTDDEHAPTAVVVNEAFAALAWPGQSSLGRRIRFPSDSIERWWTVVGVVSNTRYNDLSAPPAPEVYTSERQGPWLDPWFVVRTHLDPQDAVDVLERAVQATDPAFGISQTTTGPALLSARLVRPRALAVLFGALAGTALLLAALGLFGVLAAYVRERRREIAIRCAIGATPAQVRSLILVQTLTMASAGLACGVPMTLVGARLLGDAVRDVRPLDVPTLLAVGALLLGVVAAATYAPMLRATRVDAQAALAAE